MYLVMNKFKIKLGHEDEFEQIWKNRDSKLHTIAGFVEFKLLKGETTDKFTIFSSHVLWNSKEEFEAWTKSDAFKESHKRADNSMSLHVAHPDLECYDVII